MDDREKQFFPDFHHCALLYASPQRELEMMKHYTARFFTDRPGGEWLFDAFLFIRLINTTGVQADHARATAEDWKACLDEYFCPGREIALLDQAVEENRQVIGEPPCRRKVIITVPYPHPQTVGFGDIDGDGREEDLAGAPGRHRAMEWYMREAIRRFREAGYRHLDLWGFYWVDEAMDNDEDIVEDASRLVHELGYRFLWIPYYRAPGYEHAHRYFDVTIMQPNYAFNAWTEGGTVRAERLENTWEHCRRLGYGIEMELRSGTLYDATIFQRYLAYGAPGRLGYQNAVNAYFLGVNLYSTDTGPSANRLSEMYELLCDYVTGRPVPDPDVRIDTFALQQDGIDLLAGTEQRISSVDLLVDTRRFTAWQGMLYAEVVCGDSVRPGGWVLAAREDGERYQMFSIPMASRAEILRIHIRTDAGELPREAIRSISLDCSGKATNINYCLGKTYTLLPEPTERPYDDNALGDLLINRDIAGQRLGWFHNPVQLWLDLGAEVPADTLEIYALRGYGGVSLPQSGFVVFSRNKPVPEVFGGVGEIPQELRSAGLGQPQTALEGMPEIHRYRCRVERQMTRYVSLYLRPETLHWLMLSQLRVLAGDTVLPVSRYKLLVRPAAKLGSTHVDSGKQLTDGTESSGFDNAVVLWDAREGARTLTVDLEQPQKLHSVSLHTLACEEKEVFVPDSVVLSASDDGRNWYEPQEINRYSLTANGVGDVVFQAQFSREPTARWLRAEISPREGYCGISEITAC